MVNDEPDLLVRTSNEVIKCWDIISKDWVIFCSCKYNRRPRLFLKKRIGPS